MKIKLFRLLSLLVILSTTWTTTRADVIDAVSGRLVDDCGYAPSTREIYPTDDGFLVTYRFSHYRLLPQLTTGGDTAYRLSTEYFAEAGGYGKPASLSRRDVFECPAGTQPTLNILQVRYVDINLNLASASLSAPENGTLIAPENPIIPYDGFYPANVVGNIDVQLSREEVEAWVTVSPVLYNYATSTLRVCSEIVYEVSFGSSGVDTQSLTQITDVRQPLDSISFTPGTFYPASLSIPSPEGFLIITDWTYAEHLDDFIHWKKVQGYDVAMVASNRWTPQSIKDTIQARYNADSNLKYVLFVGDHEAVPGQTVLNSNPETEEYELITDFYYGCMDGESDRSTDLVRGRIPATTVDELDAALDKIMAYEKNPPSDSDFYKRGVHLAYFEDRFTKYSPNDVPDGISERRFDYTCEEIHNYLSSNYNKEIVRLYSAPEPLNGYEGPKYWGFNDWCYSPVQLDTVKSLYNYTWNYSFHAFQEAMKTPPLYVLYRGHGINNGWVNDTYNDLMIGTKFTSTTLEECEGLQSITQAEQLPPAVLFSITCSTGAYDDKDCYAKKWLTLPERGAVAVIAQSREGYSGINDALTFELFSNIWNVGEITDNLQAYFYQKRSKQSRIGLIMDVAIKNLNKAYSAQNYVNYISEVTHCFGDPSMIFHTEVPKEIPGVNVTYNESSVTVRCDSLLATYISLYDCVTWNHCRVYGNSASLKTDNPQNTWVYVEKDGYRPYIIEGDMPSQPEVKVPDNGITKLQDNHDGTLTVHYKLTSYTDGTITVYDTSANQFKGNMRVASGEGYVTFHVSPGLYVVSLAVNNGTSLIDYKQIKTQY